MKYILMPRQDRRVRVNDTVIHQGLNITVATTKIEVTVCRTNETLDRRVRVNDTMIHQGLNITVATTKIEVTTCRTNETPNSAASLRVVLSGVVGPKGAAVTDPDPAGVSAVAGAREGALIVSSEDSIDTGGAAVTVELAVHSLVEVPKLLPRSSMLSKSSCSSSVTQPDP